MTSSGDNQEAIKKIWERRLTTRYCLRLIWRQIAFNRILIRRLLKLAQDLLSSRLSLFKYHLGRRHANITLVDIRKLWIIGLLEKFRINAPSLFAERDKFVPMVWESNFGPKEENFWTVTVRAYAKESGMYMAIPWLAEGPAGALRLWARAQWCTPLSLARHWGAHTTREGPPSQDTTNYISAFRAIFSLHWEFCVNNSLIILTVQGGCAAMKRNEAGNVEIIWLFPYGPTESYCSGCTRPTSCWRCSADAMWRASQRSDWDSLKHALYDQIRTANFFQVPWTTTQSTLSRTNCTWSIPERVARSHHWEYIVTAAQNNDLTNATNVENETCSGAFNLNQACRWT